MDLFLERICFNFLSLSFDVKHWKSKGCNKSYNEINVQRYVQCAISVMLLLHFAINEWSFVVKQNVRCQQYRFHLFPNKYNASDRNANCSIPKNGRKSEWSIEIGNARAIRKMIGRGRKSRYGRANESERMCACVNHNQLLNIITAESEANR